MIDSQWRNVCTVVASVILMLFAMVQIIIALALNLRSNDWVDRSSTLASEKTRLTSGINIMIDCLFVFPAAWTGICASVSRHRGVYITLTVISALALLGVIGGLVDISYEFGNLNLFADAGSTNDELAIVLVVIQSLLILATVALLSFGVVALLYDCREHPRYSHKDNLLNAQTPPTYTQPPAFQSQPYLSYPRAPTALSQPAPARASTMSAYRPLTRGSPEWDRFYERYFATGQSYSDDYKRKPKRSRAHSYRY